MFSRYVSFLQRNHNLSPITLIQDLITAKNLLEYQDVDISPSKFKIKVIRKNKQALSKEDIINILNSCSDIRLKTYALLLVATGMRAQEAPSIRIKDLDFESNPAKVCLRGEYTKTKMERFVFLTNEVAKFEISCLH